MRVNHVRVLRRLPRSAQEREQEEREQQREPRPPPQVPDDPRAVSQPEVPEARRRDDLDLHPRRANVLDRVGDEAADHVPGSADTTS